MRKLGIIGGMSPESTVLYYQIINREVNRRMGGNTSADLLLHSVNFETIVQMQKQSQWEQAGLFLAQSARQLEQAGAEGLILATNTMHKVAHAISAATTAPLLHIVDTTTKAIKCEIKSEVKHEIKDSEDQHSPKNRPLIGLLGTRFTMSDGFYAERMQSLGVDLLMPNTEEQDEIHRIIFDELCLNQVTQASQNYYQSVIQSLAQQGAQGIILGCTEISLLIKQENCSLPVFDSTTIHAMAAVDFILGDE